MHATLGTEFLLINQHNRYFHEYCIDCQCLYSPTIPIFSFFANRRNSFSCSIWYLCNCSVSFLFCERFVCYSVSLCLCHCKVGFFIFRFCYNAFTLIVFGFVLVNSFAYKTGLNSWRFQAFFVALIFFVYSLLSTYWSFILRRMVSWRIKYKLFT